jgi:hypothetical protein
MTNFWIRTVASVKRTRICRTVKSGGRLNAASNRLAWLIVATLLCSPALALEAKQSSGAGIAGGTKKTVESPIHYTGIPYRSDNRRDPFLNPISSKKKSNEPFDEETDRGLAPPGISGTYIAQAALKGISIQDANRVAVVRGADKRAYFLREGDRLFDGYLKMIDADSITLVRETKMKSGKIVTQDVTMRLRTP